MRDWINWHRREIEGEEGFEVGDAPQRPRLYPACTDPVDRALV
jgi:hypothetical protein